MPKQSKVRSSRATTPLPIKDETGRFVCCSCGKDFSKQLKNFPMSQSPIYKGNGGYIPCCRNCIDDLFNQYKSSLGSEKEALKRMCLKFDIYWNEEIYNMIDKSNTSTSRVLTYISRSNLVKYQGKTFDDTLDEEYNSALPFQSGSHEQTNTDKQIEIDEETKLFWGAGFNDAWYEELDSRYKYWIAQFPDIDALEVGTQALLRQICILETQINRDLMSGKPIEKSANTLNSLLGSANLKPSQTKKEDGIDASIENMPLGVGIKKWEDTRPLPDMAPEFKDVDGIIKYITTWFYGHMGKMAGIKNFYSKLYENEISKLRVDKPEYEEDDDETLFDEIFGGVNNE